MPIVDISGLAAHEAEAKKWIRQRIQNFFHLKLATSLTGTTVTFITDETAGTGPDVRVMARLYSARLAAMTKDELDDIVIAIVNIMQEDSEHDFFEAFVIPVMSMQAGHKVRAT